MKKLLHTLKMKQARPNTEHTNKLSSVHARAQMELPRLEGERDTHWFNFTCINRSERFFPFIIFFTISEAGASAHTHAHNLGDSHEPFGDLCLMKRAGLLTG